MREATWLAGFVLACSLGCADSEPRDFGLLDEESGAGTETHAPPDAPTPDDQGGDGDGDGDPSSGDGDGDPSSGDGDGDGGPYAAPLYSADRVHSPLTPFVRDNLASILATSPFATGDLFMKIGASSTVSSKTLHCFADGPVDLGVHEPALGPTLDLFLLGDAAGTSPFDRDTLAAEVGRTASWAIEGSPSPIDLERNALIPGVPALALVHYGTNDMQQGLTYASAMPGYFASMSDLLDELIDLGMVPVVFGISHRLDSAAADRWVATYNAVSRGLAQARSIPFIDLHHALDPLANHGISGDGVHLEAYDDGACVLNSTGLEHGYNMRNLVALEGLERVQRALAGAAPEPIDAVAPVLDGEGDLDDPYLITGFPFADDDTTVGAASIEFDVYTGCESNSDQSGPERVYRFTLAETTAIRAMVLDRAGVDIDIHIVDESATEAGCIARDNRLIETTLSAGSYYAVLDTYVSGGDEQAGPYSFVLLACDDGDIDCL